MASSEPLADRVHAVDATRYGLIGVFLVAVVVRLAPLLRTHSLAGVLGVDDGAYYSAAAHLLHGSFPYRDVPFAELPGICVLLAPFAALGQLAGDSTGLLLARLVVILIGSLTAVGVTLVVRRTSPAWAIPAGLLYAIWRVPSSAERTPTLEALATAAVLAALLLLGPDRPAPSPWRVAASGAVTGLAVTVTIWAIPPAALLAGYVLARRGVRAAGPWLGGAVATAALIAGPFVALAPTRFVQQTIIDPLTRPTDATLTNRLRRFSDLARLGGYELPANVDVMLATCAIVALAAIVLNAWWEPRARLLVVMLAVQCLLVATAPDYTFHRWSAVPTFVPVAALAARHFVPDPWSGRVRRPLAAVTAAGVVALTLTAVHNVVPRSSDAASLRAFAAAHRCVWFETASVAIAANALTPQMTRGCAVPVDRIDVLESLDEPIDTLSMLAAHHSSEFQDQLAREVRAADAVVTADDEDDGVLAPDLLDDIEERFVLTGAYGWVELWSRHP